LSTINNSKRNFTVALQIESESPNIKI